MSDQNVTLWYLDGGTCFPEETQSTLPSQGSSSKEPWPAAFLSTSRRHSTTCVWSIKTLGESLRRSLLKIERLPVSGWPEHATQALFMYGLGVARLYAVGVFVFLEETRLSLLTALRATYCSGMLAALQGRVGVNPPRR